MPGGVVEVHSVRRAPVGDAPILARRRFDGRSSTFDRQKGVVEGPRTGPALVDDVAEPRRVKDLPGAVGARASSRMRRRVDDGAALRPGGFKCADAVGGGSHIAPAAEIGAVVEVQTSRRRAGCVRVPRLERTRARARVEPALSRVEANVMGRFTRSVTPTVVAVRVVGGMAHVGSDE